MAENVFEAVKQSVSTREAAEMCIRDSYINPMDLNLDYSDDESPLSLKSDFILSLCELIVGGKEGLQPVQKTIIDRCVRLVYNEYLNDPKPENMPILEDLYNLLREQEEKEAQYIATALEIYVTGSLNAVSYTHLDVYKRQVFGCFGIAICPLPFSRLQSRMAVSYTHLDVYKRQHWMRLQKLLIRMSIEIMWRREKIRYKR